MAFADTREFAYWLDQSGNNNDWTSNNLTESDVVVDSPTNNFATLNPLSRNTTYVGTLYEGNLRQTNAGGSLATMSMISGKWYWEFYCEQGTNWIDAGMIDDAEANTGSVPSAAHPTHGVQWNSNSGIVYKDGTSVATYSTWTSGDIIGFAYDQSTESITFYKNGTSQGSVTASTPVGAYTPKMANPNGVGYMRANFGQDSSFAGSVTAQGNTDSNEIGDFYYTPPSGYLALCTANLPDPDVIPTEHFNTVLWTGDGSSSRAITGVGFQPDFVWEKSRSDGDTHNLVDAVRGTTKYLYSALTNAEVTDTDRLLSFDSDGFTIGSDLSWNDSTPHNYVAWNWKANGSGVSNTDGTITSTVSANQDAGFSIVSYTGTGSSATVGHGLSTAPDMIITKSRDSTDQWIVQVPDHLSTDYGLRLQSNIGQQNDSGNIDDPTNTNIILPSGWGGNNTSGTKYIAYCFHSVDGFSKVGSYTGNQNNDGPFVYTGFRPEFIMLKNADTSDDGTDDWVIRDTTRDETNWDGNPSGYTLSPNDSGVEGNHASAYPVDILSNGFKIRNNAATYNWNNDTLIYIAFAETPFKYANAR